MTSITRYLQLNLLVWGSLWLLLLTSCEQKSTIGLGIINQADTKLIESDTFSIVASTVLADSVRSDRTVSDYFLAGRYIDPIFGKITAKSYFKIVSGVDPVKLPDDPDASSRTVDSLVLVLGLQKFTNDPIIIYPNKSATQVFHLHRVTEEISDAVNYHTFNSVAYSAAPLATITLSGLQLERLKESKFLRINLTQLAPTFASEILNMVSTQVSATAFKDNFKGFALVPDANSDANVIGFANDITTSLVVHYTASYPQQGGAIPNKNTPKTFSLFAGKSFHQLQADRAGTVLAGLNAPWQPILAKDANNNAFMQAGLGVYTKLDFPTIKNLKKLGNVVINKAILLLKPTLSTNQNMAVPDFIFMYEAGADNKIAYQTINSVRQPIRVSFDGTNNAFVAYDERDEDYEIAITRHLQYLMSGDKKNPYIMVVPANASFTVNRAVLSNLGGNIANKMRLRVFYTLYE